MTSRPGRTFTRAWWTVGVAAVVFLGRGAAPAAAQGGNVPAAVATAQIEQELTTVREELRRAFNSGDVELLLSYCHPQVIATWPNGDVAVGHDGVRKIIDTLVKSADRPFDSYQVNPTVENRVVLDEGRVVVSRGQFNDEYTLTQPKGQQVRLGSLWTATLIRSADRWLITSFHLSANAFDNPVISLYLALQRTVWAVVGGVVGLIVGGALGMWWTRRQLAGSAAR